VVSDGPSVTKKEKRASATSAQLNRYFADIFQDDDDDDDPILARPLRGVDPDKVLLRNGSRARLPKPADSFSTFYAANAKSENLEPWEINPGRVLALTEAGRPDQTVAYSATYITSKKNGVRLRSGAWFSVLYLRGGGTHRWTAEETQALDCAVAVGKVRVVMGGEHLEFTAGPHGIFTVEARQACEIVNQTYTEVVVHVYATEQ
jgi:hypothetical protein